MGLKLAFKYFIKSTLNPQAQFKLQIQFQMRGYKIYTRTGDSGLTSLSASLPRMPKSQLIFQVLGDNDELSSSFGISIEMCKSIGIKSIPADLINAQKRIQDINSTISMNWNKLPDFKKEIIVLEERIDEMTSQLPELKSFILPSNCGLTAAHLHLSRAICRRSERSLCNLLLESEESKQEEKENQIGEFNDKDKDIDVNIKIKLEKEVEILLKSYLNRLSDYLFTAARFCAHSEHLTETTYSSKQNQNE